MTQVCLVLILGVRGLPVSSVGPSKTSWGDKEWGFLSSNNEAVALVPFFRGQVGHPLSARRFLPAWPDLTADSSFSSSISPPE